MNFTLRPTGPTHSVLRSGVFVLIVLFAFAATACGGSQSSPKASPGTSASPDLSAYDLDSGGTSGASDVAGQFGWTDRGGGFDVFEHLPQAYSLIEHALPAAQVLDQVDSKEPGDVSNETAVFWQPEGRRETLMPPSPHGDRIYVVVISLDPYLQGGDAVARISFISAADGDALKAALEAGTTTPPVTPSKNYDYRLDGTTAAALLSLFYQKGAT